MKHRQLRMITILLALVCVAVAGNLALTAMLLATEGSGPSLPCAAIPMRFVVEEPACADKLVRSMNVTNVRIQRFDESIVTTEAPPNNESS